MNRTYNLSPILLVILLVALILAATELLVTTLGILLLVFAGLLFGVFIYGISHWISRHTPGSYRLCYIVVVALIVLLLGGGFYYLGSQIAQRAENLWSELQSALQQIEQQLTQYDWAQQYLPDASQVQQTLTQSQSQVIPRVMSGLRWAGWAVTGALVIFFIGLYAAYEPDLYRSGLVRLASRQRRPRVKEVLSKLRTAMTYWIFGRLLSMAIIGILTAIGLTILGVPLPITLGVVAAFLTFIPNIGPLLAAVPQVLLALDVGTNTVLYVIIFNIVLQAVESYLITPLIQRREVTLPPILTITAQLMMAVWIGVIGIMMAAPLVVVIMVLIQMLYIHDQLGDEHAGRLTSES